MVFMNGDNNLELDALKDFAEMAKVTTSDRVNVVVQLDRNGSYAITQPQWTQTLRFHVTKGQKPLPANALADLGELNMGDGAVLRDFVRWAKGAYPAKRYMLIIWDHGQGYRLWLEAQMQAKIATRVLKGTHSSAAMMDDRGFVLPPEPRSDLPLTDPPTQGPFRSVSTDATDKGDKLYNREIQDVLQGERVDVIGFDACLMAMLETAYAMRGVAQVMVSSEELEPGTGWQYDDWLQKLVDQPAMDAKQLGRVLVESYKRRYGDNATTLSAVDLSMVEPLAAAVSALADALSQALTTEPQTVLAARNDCAEYAPDAFGDGENYFQHVDIGRLARQVVQRAVSPQLRESAERVQAALTATTLANYAGAPRLDPFGSAGLAIYFPRTGTHYRNDLFEEGGYQKNNTLYPIEFVQRQRWADFLHAYFASVT